MKEIAPNVAELWEQYLAKDEKYRNDRLKMIARCTEISLFLFILYIFSFISRSLVCEKTSG
jgi:hypothetical protein